MRKLTRELQVVNRAREKLNIAPLTEFPKARPGSPENCLMARSFGCRVYGSAPQYLSGLADADVKTLNAHWRNRNVWTYVVPLPPLLDKLAVEFDAGRLPELVEEAKAVA
jgi:hypothetical protein